MPATFDLLIVGSGPSGTHAALAAIDAGATVALVDVGEADDGPGRHSSSMRLTGLRAGAHLDADQLFMVRDADVLFPLSSHTFAPLQATALGGLANAWGANCFALRPADLEDIGLPAEPMRRYYDDVVRAIGVSGVASDDLSDDLANIDRSLLRPPAPLDANAVNLLARYHRRRQNGDEGRNFVMGQGMAARIVGEPEYRPGQSVQQLLTSNRFTLLSSRLVTGFVDHRTHVRVATQGRVSLAHETFTARRVILAGGAINSARLALASLGLRGSRQPFLCNRNHWMAAVNMSMCGSRSAASTDGVAQLTALVRSCGSEPEVVAQTYSYHRHDRLAEHVPWFRPLARAVLRTIGDGLTIINVHFADRPSPNRWLSLEDAPDTRRVIVHATMTPDEARAYGQQQRVLSRHLRQLGCFPIMTRVPVFGASLHYAGTLPLDDTERPGTTMPNGVLAGTTNVHVADGSSWRALPAKGPTLTLMANARRVAHQALAS